MLNCLNLTNPITAQTEIYLVPNTFLSVVAAKSLVEWE